MNSKLGKNVESAGGYRPREKSESKRRTGKGTNESRTPPGNEYDRCQRKSASQGKKPRKTLRERTEAAGTDEEGRVTPGCVNGNEADPDAARAQGENATIGARRGAPSRRPQAGQTPSPGELTRQRQAWGKQRRYKTQQREEEQESTSRSTSTNSQTTQNKHEGTKETECGTPGRAEKVGRPAASKRKR